MTLQEIGKEFGISYRTLMNWQHKKGSKDPEILKKRHFLLQVLKSLNKEDIEKIKTKSR